MKKSLSIFLCVVSVLVFCAFPFGMAVYADVVSSTVDFTKDVIQNYTLIGVVNKYYNSTQKKIEAARSYYFYMICNDSFSSGCTVFDSSGTKFTDDILDFYYEQYKLALSGSDVYVSDGDIYLSAAGFSDVPFSLRLLSFNNWPLTTSDSKDFKNYYNSFLARYLIAQSENATDPNPGKSGLDIAPGYVTSEELVDGIEKDNSFYTPKGELIKISYRTDKMFQTWTNFPSTARNISYMSYIIDNNRFVSSGGSEEMYFLFFYNEDGTEFISEYQGRLYFEVECIYDDSGSVSSVAKYPRLQVWNNVDGSPSEPIEIFDSTVDCSEYKYYFLYLYNSSSYIYLKGYKTFSDFLNNRNFQTWSKAYFTGAYATLFSSDFNSSKDYDYLISGSSSHNYFGNYDYHSALPCQFDNNCDIGLYVSSTPIYFTYRDIDTTKIPSNQIITINGDTIYNYTITNPETGDSSKFGDYITNNYTYITNNYGDESGGSGSGASGNVTVGGSIDVGGSVGVDINVSVPDININVNGNGGAGGSGSSIANPDDFTSADNVDLNKYYDTAVEQSTGFQKFLKDFFGFLPPELLGLILFAVAMAIVCRVFGR